MATTANPQIRHARKIDLPQRDGSVKTVYVVSTDLELDDAKPGYDKTAFDQLTRELIDYCDEDPADDHRQTNSTLP